MTIETDIFISGGGIAGLTAALALAQNGLSVTLADPSDGPTGDTRSTAFLQPATALFKEIGIWDALAPHATPLETLTIADCRGAPPEIHTSRAFAAACLLYTSPSPRDA